MTNDADELELQSTTDTGQPVARRLSTPAAAFAIAKGFDEADEDSAKVRALVQGMIDGNPPYVQAELDELGLGDIVNVNFLSLRANLDARAASAHELFLEVPTLIEAAPYSKAGGIPENHHHYCSVVAEEFSTLLLDWPQFMPAMDLVGREADAFGIGFVLFQDEHDWRCKAFRRGNLRFDPKASVEVDVNDIYICRDEFRVGELFEFIKDEKVARARGWKVAEVRDLIVRVFNTGSSDDDKYQKTTWESLQHMARNHDPNFEEKQISTIRVRHMLVREVAEPRGVSHFIIPDRQEDGEVFLYESMNKFGNMHEAIWWLPYNYGDGYARSVRGVASLMVQHDDLSNRFLCRVFDAGFLGASLLLQPQTPGDLGRLSFIHHGPYTILPPELKATQSTFQPQIAPLLSLRNVSENVMKNNTGLYRQHNESIEKRRPRPPGRLSRRPRRKRGTRRPPWRFATISSTCCIARSSVGSLIRATSRARSSGRGSLRPSSSSSAVKSVGCRRTSCSTGRTTSGSTPRAHSGSAASASSTTSRTS